MNSEIESTNLALAAAKEDFFKHLAEFKKIQSEYAETLQRKKSLAQKSAELQAEIEEDSGIRFDGRVKNARQKVRVQRKQLSAEEQKLFDAIWQKINYQTRYSVKLDTSRLVAECAQALADRQQYPAVAKPKVLASKGKIVMDAEGVAGVASAVNEQEMDLPAVVPDVYAYIQSRVHISRASVYAILKGCGRLDELLVNPQAFLDMAVEAMRNTLQALQVEGIEYREVNGRRYEMTLFDPLETYLSSVYPQAEDSRTTPLSKTLMQAQPLDVHDEAVPFDCVLSESEVESRFARDCALDEQVRFFFKLPGSFKINTPLGTYNPDWAVVFAGDKRVYFVAETKSSTQGKNLRRDERLKIHCGKKHFAALGKEQHCAALAQDVGFEAVPSLEVLKTYRHSPIP